MALSTTKLTNNFKTPAVGTYTATLSSIKDGKTENDTILSVLLIDEDGAQVEFQGFKDNTVSIYISSEIKGNQVVSSETSFFNGIKAQWGMNSVSPAEIGDEMATGRTFTVYVTHYTNKNGEKQANYRTTKPVDDEVAEDLE